MTPYADFAYFLFLIYPLGPALALGAARRLNRGFILLASVAMLALQYGDPLHGGAGARQLLALGGDVAWSLAVIYGFAPWRRRRGAYYAAVALCLLPLAAVKLAPLAGGPLAAAGDAVGFLGISYLTFRVLDVVILLHDGVLPGAPDPRDLLAYLLFFPTISAGPIDRFRRFVADLRQPPADYPAEVEAGIYRIAQGFLYKFVIAHLIDRYALAPAAAASGLAATLAYMYAYSLYLFFDFAGYSAFAIGVGRLLGVRVPENFAAPFLSPNFRELWNRWHMSLSFWFRDHVYMRFVLGAARRRWFGGNRLAASYVGFLVTMGLMGCWHGLQPHYVVYGLYQGVMLVVYDALGRWRRRRPVGGGRFAKAAAVFVTGQLFCFGLLIFSGRLFT